MPRFPSPATRVALGCALAASLHAGAAADPADYVFVPYANGTREIAWSAGVAHGPGGERDSQQALSVGFMPMKRWFTDLYGAWAAEDGAGWRADEWTWLNHVQLTEPGAAPVAVGLLCEVSRPHERDEGTGYACGPTLQLDTDDLQFNVDPAIAWHAGAADGARASLGYQWQAKGLWRPGVEFGAQGFGDFGPWNRWARFAQERHTLGPAIFAKWALSGGQVLHVDAAWLVGVGSGSPGQTLRMRLALDF